MSVAFKKLATLLGEGYEWIETKQEIGRPTIIVLGNHLRTCEIDEHARVQWFPPREKP